MGKQTRSNKLLLFWILIFPTTTGLPRIKSCYVIQLSFIVVAYHWHSVSDMCCRRVPHTQLSLVGWTDRPSVREIRLHQYHKLGKFQCKRESEGPKSNKQSGNNPGVLFRNRPLVCQRKDFQSLPRQLVNQSGNINSSNLERPLLRLLPCKYERRFLKDF